MLLSEKEIKEKIKLAFYDPANNHIIGIASNVERLFTLFRSQQREARLHEHQLLQHQGMNVLTKTPKAILGWSELRVEQLKEGK